MQRSSGRIRTAVFILGLATCPTLAPASDLWIELINGDLSDDRFTPTPFVLSPGDNFLFGVMEGDNGEGGFDRDFFSVTVPQGFQLSQFVLDNYDSTDFAAFIAIGPGPNFPNDPDDVAPQDVMGFLHMGPTHIGQDMLPLMSAQGYGFTTPLPAGVYSFWAQQIDSYTDWVGNFVVTEVPEPSSLAGVLIGAVVIRRRARPNT